MTQINKFVISLVVALAIRFTVPIPLTTAITQETPTSHENGILPYIGSPYNTSLFANNALITPPMTPKDIEAMIIQKAKASHLNAKIMLDLAKCESGLRQFDKHGAVLPGRIVPSDKGIYQINLTYWSEASDLTGYDWRTPEGNIDLAMWIAKNYGYHKWMCLPLI